MVTFGGSAAVWGGWVTYTLMGLSSIPTSNAAELKSIKAVQASHETALQVIASNRMADSAALARIEGDMRSFSQRLSDFMREFDRAAAARRAAGVE
jgi:hypothetical protein